MKTQINTLRSGSKNLLLNPNTDYSTLPRSTSHSGFVGTSHADAGKVWGNIVSENPDCLCIELFGRKFTLSATHSISGKSTYYACILENEFVSKNVPIDLAKDCVPFLQINGATDIVVGNGLNDFVQLCPSFITIL
jgi:hypothetical protein